MPAAHPVPIALVVCENAYVDSSNKHALVGLFGRIVGQNESGPIAQAKLIVYASMTDVYPGTVVQIRIVNGETDRTVTEVKSPPAPADINPTRVWDFIVEIRGLEFPDAGTYFVRFSANNRTLVERPFEVVRLKKEKRTDDE